MEKFVLSRNSFYSGGQKVYEWEQSLEDVDVYIEAPPGIRSRYIVCEIKPRNVSIGIKGNPPFIDEPLHDLIKPEESLWTMEGGIINISLRKSIRGQTWPSVFQGHESLNPNMIENVQKTMLLQRFQEENPGIDFSDAKFNGQVPDPQTFMLNPHPNPK